MPAALARVAEGQTWLRARGYWFVRSELAVMYLARKYGVPPGRVIRVDRTPNALRLLARLLAKKKPSRL